MKAEVGEDIKAYYRPYERKGDAAWRETKVDNMVLELPDRYEVWDISTLWLRESAGAARAQCSQPRTRKLGRP